jgi:hypothetical protein
MSGKDSKSNSITKLTSSNYPTWKGEIKAYLRVKGLRLLVNGSETCLASDTDLQAKWDVKADKAAGELYLACSVEQRMHIDAVQDDPVKIWTTLASIHLQQRPGAHSNTWDDFFSIRKQPDESLSTLIARIEDGMSKIKELHPTGGKTAYGIIYTPCTIYIIHHHSWHIHSIPEHSTDVPQCPERQRIRWQCKSSFF